MRHRNRKEKLATLHATISGNSTALRKYQHEQQEVWFMVVTDNSEPKPTDLVDTRLSDSLGRKQVPYADFLKNPATYGRFCITVT